MAKMRGVKGRISSVKNEQLLSSDPNIEANRLPLSRTIVPTENEVKRSALNSLEDPNPPLKSEDE